ncbi:D-aspartate oxidase [Diutina catenulata]
MKSVVIVGSGVLGLSTAWAIKESDPSTHVVVIAKYGPHVRSMNTLMTNESTYTSPWAGAHYRPFPSKNPQEAVEAKLTRVTQERFRKLAESNPESSVKFITGVEYFEAPDHFYKEVAAGYREEIDDFEVLPPSELPDGVEMGTRYRTWAVNSPVYLQWLYRKLFYTYLVDFVEADLKSLREVNDYVRGDPVIINCSGQGLQYDGGYDPMSYPIRGQTLLIRPPPGNKYADATVTHQSADGMWTFCIPRPLDGGMILGGTKQVRDTYGGVRDEDTASLKRRGAKLFPELMRNGEFDVVNINVGFRPAREGGLNTSLERCQDHPGRRNHVINNYGAGGMGYELSYGSGMEAVKHLRSLSLTPKL